MPAIKIGKIRLDILLDESPFFSEQLKT